MDELLARIRACRVCEAHLPLGARPIVQAGDAARVVIIGQAPGRRVHETGVPWNDPSGNRLREWLGIPREVFYDPERIAIIPMGFCYPGSAASGDRPPRPECAPLWHDALLARLPPDALRIVIGRYAQVRYVPESKGTLTRTVEAWRDYLPDRFVLPHPSPRNRGWFKHHPWFEEEAIPVLRERVADALSR